VWNSGELINKIIDVEEKKKGAKNASLWNSAKDLEELRVNTINDCTLNTVS